MARRFTSKSNHQKGIAPASFFKYFFGFIGVVFIAFATYILTSAVWHFKDLPDVASLEKYEPIEAIQIFDRNDHLICTVEGDEDRRVVPLNQICTQMQQAMLAAEDHHFFEHHGVDIASTFRALMVNLQARHVREGGSTITQQLVKNLFFNDAGRTIDRKIKEAIIAYEIERRYPKEKILELYFNQIYFGSGAYGIERAAYRYFDKNAANLTLAESAFLAGLVKAPSEFSANREAALLRQKEILNKMVEYGYITEAQAQNAKNQKLVFKKGVNPFQNHPYYISYVLQLLREHFSQSEMRQQGLRVYTNLDPEAQTEAERVLNESIKKAPKGVSQSALVSVSVSDGAVIALVGGVGNFWKNQWNRATNPHTTGSSFKPFVYLTAFIKGVLSPDSIIADEPLVVKQRWGLPNYCPKNFDHRFMGKIPVWRALALSRNVCSVRIAQMVGIDNVVETARSAGVTAKLDPNLSLALGSSAVSPLDMAGAYATFARGGIAIKPQVIRRVENNKGEVVEVFEIQPNKVFEPEPVAQLVKCMQGVVQFGTGTQARLPDRPVAGKTGTADESKDIWFIGFTPDLVTALWAGNDEDKPIPGTYVTGGGVMAKIWKAYNLAYYAKHPTPPGSFLAPTAKAVAVEKKEGETLPEPSGRQLLPAPSLTPQAPVMDTTNSTQQNYNQGTSSYPSYQTSPNPPVSPSYPSYQNNSIPSYSPSPAPTVNQANPSPSINQNYSPPSNYQSSPYQVPSTYPPQQTYSAPAPNYLPNQPPYMVPTPTRRLYPAPQNEIQPSNTPSGTTPYQP